ncbi:transcriptional regulator, MerR family [Sphingomonas palmae]|uniref:Transcriptional regulator, MerR family n=1 Tax=Sphingomonas palmae TaxID=1855283 RepID=A0A1H7U1D8_9SPHN|nr:MerR family transcriptional regulator [Sphingomonas palmae]SEL90589.1 transcriptional regulator, MerR family [Sphingomonas palmae]
MNIGQAAKASGLSERMIRYFEKQGLIPEPARSEGGYRAYGDADVKRMRTIALAQDVGFSTNVIAQLLTMMDRAGDGDHAAEDEALAEFERKTEALRELRGRIDGMLDRARARMADADAETDIDWRAPSPDKPRGLRIERVNPERPPSARETPRRDSRQRDLTSVD